MHNDDKRSKVKNTVFQKTHECLESIDNKTNKFGAKKFKINCDANNISTFVHD